MGKLVTLQWHLCIPPNYLGAEKMIQKPPEKNFLGKKPINAFHFEPNAISYVNMKKKLRGHAIKG